METETKGRKEKSKNRAVPYLTKNEASVDSGTDGHQHNAERERWQEEIGRHNWATATRSKKSRSELTKALDLAAVKQK
jgi:hypothetical protein